MKKKKIKIPTVKEMKSMPMFTYQCELCEADFDLHVALDDRNKAQKCSVCGGIAKRVFTSPSVFIGRPGTPHESRPDEFWDRSEKKKQKEITKRTGEEREKIRFGDKHTLGKLHNQYANYKNNGEDKKAEQVAKKVEGNKKWEKKIQVQVKKINQ
jgi:putative FmdB family regulatory protein